MYQLVLKIGPKVSANEGHDTWNEATSDVYGNDTLTSPPMSKRRINLVLILHTREISSRMSTLQMQPHLLLQHPPRPAPCIAVPSLLWRRVLAFGDAFPAP